MLPPYTNRSVCFYDSVKCSELSQAREVRQPPAVLKKTAPDPGILEARPRDLCQRHRADLMVPRLCPAVALGDTGIFRLLAVRKMAQRLEAEGREAPPGDSTSKRRPVTGPAGARPEQSRSVQPPDRVAADFLAEDLLQRDCKPGHRHDERPRKRDASGGHSCIISKGQWSNRST